MSILRIFGSYSANNIPLKTICQTKLTYKEE